MSESELIEKYKKEFCSICNSKKTDECNIKVFYDYRNKIRCCKCIYFNSDKINNSELTSY